MSDFSDLRGRVSIEASCSSESQIDTRLLGIFATRPLSLSFPAPPNLILISHTTYCERTSDDCILKFLLSVAALRDGFFFFFFCLGGGGLKMGGGYYI